MGFIYDHTNINVFNLERSIEFYQEALGLHECGRITPDHGQFILVYLADVNNTKCLELTWLANRKEPYNLGDNEIHMAFEAENYENAHSFHQKRGYIVFENPELGIYFMEDPDGYWVEIIEKK